MTLIDEIRTCAVRTDCPPELCRVDGCTRHPWSRGLCRPHYNAAQHGGQLDRVATPKPGYVPQPMPENSIQVTESPDGSGDQEESRIFMGPSQASTLAMAQMKAATAQVEMAAEKMASLQAKLAAETSKNLELTEQLSDADKALLVAQNQIVDLQTKGISALNERDEAKEAAHNALAELEAVKAEKGMADVEIKHLEAALKDAEDQAQRMQALLDAKDVAVVNAQERKAGAQLRNASVRSLVDSAADAMDLLDQLGIPQTGDLSQRIQMLGHLGNEAQERVMALVESQHYAKRAHGLRMRAQGLGAAVREAE